MRRQIGPRGYKDHQATMAAVARAHRRNARRSDLPLQAMEAKANGFGREMVLKPTLDKEFGGPGALAYGRVQAI
jgi:hypothetical protein